MGIVVLFKARRHGRASAGSAGAAGRAASSTNISAETPAFCAVSVASNDAHHSSGILSRWSHFRADAGGAPISIAIAPGEVQRPMIERNEFRTSMESSLGQSVLNGKAILSHDCGHEVDDNDWMARQLSETEQKRLFIQRTKLAREARFPKQKPILTILEIDQGTYKQYETRTPLPHRYIPKFCAATGTEIDWLLTGDGKGPAASEIPKQQPRRIRKPAKPKAA